MLGPAQKRVIRRGIDGARISVIGTQLSLSKTFQEAKLSTPQVFALPTFS